MRKKQAILSAVLALLLCVGTLSACKKEKPVTIPPEGYSYDPGDNETTAASSAELPSGAEQTTAGTVNEGFTVNTAWQRNFFAEYLYFDKKLDGGNVRIREIKTENAFEAKYPDSGNFYYYESQDGDLVVYTVIPGEDTYDRSVTKGKTVADISSTFMKLSAVEETFSALPNVLYMLDEDVAGRPCKKYIQRAYTDGKVTETVYIWIDAAYGFAAKCEAYDANDQLTTSWELMLFETGDVKDSRFDVDLDDYDFGEV